MQQRIPKPHPRLVALLITATAILGGITIYGIHILNSLNNQQVVENTIKEPVKRAISALGRLEPATEVIQLAAPITLDGDRLLELRVGEGDQVEAGQILAILDSRDRLETAVQQAREQVKQAQARLEQVKAGAKLGEVQAQQATILSIQAEIQGEIRIQAETLTRLTAEYQNAQAEYHRYQQLYQEGAISQSTFDTRRLEATTAEIQLREAQQTQNRTLETLEAQLKEARATLDQIAEVRPVDIQVAQTEVDTAIASLQEAETLLEQANIKAPISGQILKIHTRPGEKIGDSILDLGQTEQMIAIAEVYQSDISKIRLGQSATISGQGFDGELPGEVSLIGSQVNRQNTFSNQPGENLDRRVIEVRITLTREASRLVAGLTNMQVLVKIEP